MILSGRPDSKNWMNVFSALVAMLYTALKSHVLNLDGGCVFNSDVALLIIIYVISLSV